MSKMVFKVLDLYDEQWNHEALRRKSYIIAPRLYCRFSWISLGILSSCISRLSQYRELSLLTPI